MKMNDPIWLDLNQQTAKISWKELQRFFASGQAIYVAPSLDLVESAYVFAKDDSEQLQSWMEQEQVYAVRDEQARHWLETDALVWAVVVRPLILVQPITESPQ